MKNKIHCLVFAMTVLNINPAYSQEDKTKVTTTPTEKQTNYDWEFKGQVLLRGEFDGRDFTNQTAPNAYTSIRTRLSAEKSFTDNVDFLMQIEDSRLLGESGVAVSNFKNLDLHQGFINFKSPFSIPASLQIGRFEVDYSNGRFFSALPGWNYIGRAFDGARIKYENNSLFGFKADVFALSINTSSKYVSNATPLTYLLPSAIDIGNGLYGFWTTGKFSPANEVNAFGYYEDNRKQTKVGFNDVARFTTGLNHKGSYGDFSSVEEISLQKGSVSGQEVTAYLGSIQAYYQINDFKLGLGADILSGNNPSSKNTNNTFSNPYTNGHLYLGYMDYFTNTPDNTKNLGVNDYYFKTVWDKKDFPLNAKLDLHHFMSNQVSSNGLSTFGQEADLTLNYAYSKQGTLTFGLSGFLSGDLFKSDSFFGSKRTDPSYWAYLMTIYNF